MTNENIMEAENCPNCKADIPQDKSCDNMPSPCKETEAWMRNGLFVWIAIVLYVITLIFYNRLDWIAYVLLPAILIVTAIIAYILRVRETPIGYFTTHIITFLLAMSFGIFVLNFFEHLRWLRVIVAFVVLIGAISYFIYWLKDWEDWSVGDLIFTIISLIFVTLMFLQTTYFPNIVARPANTMTNLTIGRPVMTEVHYNQRGFIGVYRTTGTATISYRDGLTFVGDVVNGVRYGQGEATWSDGRRYIGEFYSGFRHGQGEMTWSDGGMYIGEWYGGRRHGQGEMTWSDGRIYIGEWYEGRLHGQGEMTWPDGVTYIGEWYEDWRHGVGIMWNSDRTKKYVGEWIEDRRTGVGTLYDAQGNVIEADIWEQWIFIE